LVELAVRERAAQRLVSFGPKGLTKAFFVNSGAEANENALRIAMLANKRPRVIAVNGAFHGRTAAAAALTAGHEKWYAFPHTPMPVTVVPVDNIDALAAAMGPDVSAVIFEPIQGVAGARALSFNFVQAAKDLTQKHGACLIFDEVQCGVGRTGYPFAAQAYGVTPDLLTTAKGLAGGFPVGAVLVSDAYACKVGKGQLGTTFGGGPLASALVEAVIDTIEKEALLPRVRRLSARLMKECVVGPVYATQGMGYLLGLRTHAPASALLSALRDRGILAGSSSDPNVVRLLPPLVLQDEHVDTLVNCLKEISL
jgi:acetylornithine/succinyldiaminopimelate/putrescine aminotransferase